jgi:uncharacterized protein
MTRVLIVPGLNGSGPEHWQSKWEALDTRCTRVELPNWDAPQLASWLGALTQAVESQTDSVLLVAHSLGSVLVAHWARHASPQKVLGALLVAPADVDSPQHTPACARGFAPIPLTPLPFPSMVVASRNDPYADFERAVQWAEHWGSQLVDAGEAGHINSDSKLGSWPKGRALLSELLHTTPFKLDSRLSADTVCIAESGLSLLLLMNDSRYPWLILVPKISGLTEIFELDEDDRSRLWEESCALGRALSLDFCADKVNVGAQHRASAARTPHCALLERSRVARSGMGTFCACSLCSGATCNARTAFVSRQTARVVSVFIVRI